MINRKLDATIFGQSYLSLSHGIDRLKSGENVLLIDDDRVRFGPQMVTDLSLLEKYFLQYWGEDKGIDGLANIDQYIHIWPIHFLVGPYNIKLGDSPFKNFVEISRKFWFCFSDSKSNDYIGELIRSASTDNFDIKFQEYMKFLSKRVYYFTNSQELNFELLTKDCPKIVLELFTMFSNCYRGKLKISENDLWHFRSFVYSAKGLYHKDLSTELTDFELFHLFCRLLSPLYRLKHGELVRTLYASYCELGGEHKVARLDQIQLKNKRPWGIQLSSFEGIIKPQKVLFMGGEIRDPSFKLNNKQSYFQSIEVEYELEGNNLFHADEQRFLVSHHSRMGTSRPAVDLYISGDKVFARIFRKKQEGLKASFLKDEIERSMADSFKKLSIDPRSLSEVIKSEKFSLGNDLWVDQGISGDFARGRMDPPQNKLTKVLPTMDKISPIKDVSYFGPLKGNSLGLLGIMMDLKESRPRIPTNY